MDNYTCSLCGAVFTFAENAAKHFIWCKSQSDMKNDKYWDDINERLRVIREQIDQAWGKQAWEEEVKPVKNDRLNAVINLIRRGATPGERDAAKSAYRRLTGKEYIG